VICAKRASWPASSATALVALAAVTLMLIAPAAALDRLLAVGGDALGNWLDQACNTVGEMDMQHLELLRQRVVALQAEAEAQTQITQGNLDKAVEEWEKAGGKQTLILGHIPGPMVPPAPKVVEALALRDKSRENSVLVDEKSPAVLDCIEQAKTRLTKAEPAAPASCGSPGGGVVITTSVNTPCSLNLAAVFGLPPSAFSDMRLESQPSHGKVDWSNGVLTYTPAPDYRGPDSFTMSATHKTAVNGESVDVGRENQVWGIAVQ
jgi:Big-like domain-containing protein